MHKNKLNYTVSNKQTPFILYFH